ncbi:hypothetical protein TIFTF001_002348 [Ficus carica]|uniref:Uncharacterized protein n=1 Tax=Ficus carica TaxID=3494 RepID=A0AA87ZB43_FICCA|nr:hypothetical protein TIFTF001_002348 [Ficus carica]
MVRLRFEIPNQRLITCRGVSDDRKADLSLPEKEDLKTLNRPSCKDADGQKSLRRSEPTANLTPAHGRRWGGNRVFGRRAEARSRAELQGIEGLPISHGGNAPWSLRRLAVADRVGGSSRWRIWVCESTAADHGSQDADGVTVGGFWLSTGKGGRGVELTMTEGGRPSSSLGMSFCSVACK